MSEFATRMTPTRITSQAWSCLCYKSIEFDCCPSWCQGALWLSRQPIGLLCEERLSVGLFFLVSSSFIMVHCAMYTCAPAFLNGFTVRPKVWTGLAIHPSETMLPASARRCLPCGSMVVSQLAVARTWDATRLSELDDAFFIDLLFSTGWFVG